MQHDLVLAGHGVRLVPRGPEHSAALLALIDDDLWAGMTSPPPRTVADVDDATLAAQADPGRYAFAVLSADAADAGQVRGTTSFYDVALGQGRCEVGHTFYGRRWWGGRTNPACKLALLTHAFEVWGMARVALRADARNARSIGAMERLGCVREGVLRGHRLAADGTRQDTVMLSMLAPEWPAAKERLLARLEAWPSS
jgi:RimJ/RimL family protein N-acetyltransferase